MFQPCSFLMSLECVLCFIWTLRVKDHLYFNFVNNESLGKNRLITQVSNAISFSTLTAQRTGLIIDVLYLTVRILLESLFVSDRERLNLSIFTDGKEDSWDLLHYWVVIMCPYFYNHMHTHKLYLGTKHLHCETYR